MKNLIALRDTILYAFRIIEEVNYPSPTDVKYLISSRAHFGKVGLRTDNSATLHNLAVNLTKSNRESRHQLIASINQQIELISTNISLTNKFSGQHTALIRIS